MRSLLTNSPPLSESDFPAAYIAADKTSLKGQQRFLRATRIRLVAVLAAAVLGALTTVQDVSRLAAILSAVSFGLAFVVEMYLWRTRPDRAWYDGRAGAESAKTLTWRFVVGGRPFEKDERSDTQTEKLFLDRLHEVIGALKSVPLVGSAPATAQITDRMRELRSRPLGERKQAYLDWRIGDQQSWYAAKASANEKQGNRWTLLLAGLEGTALLAAILLAAGAFRIDLLGVAATAIGVAVAWMQAKQYQGLASAYSVACLELAEIRSRGISVTKEADWAEFADQSEEAISREHTLWRASRGA